MFRLDYETPPEWVTRVEREPLALLSDHAHCELKAAAAAQALIKRNAGSALLTSRLTEMAAEEMEHFDTVVAELEQRGGSLGQRSASPYAQALHAGSTRGRRHALLDRLLVAGLIEARSLERFHLLAEHLADRSLAKLYKDLVPSEALHQGLFQQLARELFPREMCAQREVELRALEGGVVAGLPFAPRVHSGLGSPGTEPGGRPVP